MTLFKGPLYPLDDASPALRLHASEAFAPEFGNRVASEYWFGRPFVVNAYGRGRIRPRHLPTSPSRPSRSTSGAEAARECTRH